MFPGILLMCVPLLLTSILGDLSFKFDPISSMYIENKSGQNFPWLRLLFNFSFLAVIPFTCYYSIYIVDLLNNEWGYHFGLPIAITLVALIVATVAISFRTSIFPSWFGWVSALIILGLPITPYAWIAATGWLFVVSIWLYRGQA